jgi:hypothetical protein
MIKFDGETLKIVVISIFSWSIYFFLNYSKKINITILEIQDSNSSRTFGYYVLFNILKWFFLILGMGAIIMFLKTIFKKKN